MGHSTITTTLDLYGHLFPGAERDFIGLADRYLNETRPDAKTSATISPWHPRANGDAVTERERVAHLLRQTANAIAAPQQVGPNRWHGHDESLTTMSVWCLLDVLATVVQAAHLSNAELRQTCGEARNPLVIGMAF